METWGNGTHLVHFECYGKHTIVLDSQEVYFFVQLNFFLLENVYFRFLRWRRDNYIETLKGHVPCLIDHAKVYMHTLVEVRIFPEYSHVFLILYSFLKFVEN